jgi:hypothetical protein
MTLISRRELVATVLPRYDSASKSVKKTILDELVQTTGYNRKYAITALRRPRVTLVSVGGGAGFPRVRQRKYGPDVAHAFLSVWRISGSLCCKRLVPFLGDLVEALERFDELPLCPEVKVKLLTMSASTGERILRRSLRAREHGLSTTLPGTLLRHQIPIRTYEEWSDIVPGFFEIDLVAHCGGTASGAYLYTLTMTDIYTGWTECCALINRSQLTVQAGIDLIRRRLPFPLLGIDSDNGAEFINHHLKRYCDERDIRFTRCRPYKKNDQCHVEQKNGAVVRPLVGYARYEGVAAAAYLNRLYAAHRFCLNFFEPSMKLIGKTREGARVKKEYDTAKTPWQRLLNTSTLSSEDREHLTQTYRNLNPAQLRRTIEELEAGLRRFTAKDPSVCVDAGEQDIA